MLEEFLIISLSSITFIYVKVNLIKYQNYLFYLSDLIYQILIYFEQKYIIIAIKRTNTIVLACPMLLLYFCKRSPLKIAINGTYTCCHL